MARVVQLLSVVICFFFLERYELLLYLIIYEKVERYIIFIIVKIVRHLFYTAKKNNENVNLNF